MRSKAAITYISRYHYTEKSDAKRHSRLAELVGRQQLKVSAGLLVITRLHNIDISQPVKTNPTVIP
jgi:hypothetical protein